MSFRLISFLAFILFLNVSCSKIGLQSSKKRKNAERVDGMRNQVDKAWTSMIQSDDQKIADINRLLLEISYSDKYDEPQLALLKQRAGSLASTRYQQYGMTSDEIDQYDNATTSLIRSVLELADKIPDLDKNDLSAKLRDDILKADEEVVIYRIRYDREAKAFNNYLKEEANMLKKLGEPYSSYKPLPLFELSQ